MIQPGAKRPACLRRSPSRPSPRLRSISSVRQPTPACRAGPSSWMPAMAAIRSCAPTSPRSGSVTSPGSCPTPRSGQGCAPLPPKPWSGRGRPPKLIRRDNEHQPISVKALALALEQAAWSETAWREGAVDRLTSRFARVRVRAAHRDYWLGEPRPEEWLLIEWPEGEKEPTKYWFSTLPEDISFVRLVELAKLRWRIERDYQELKQELGLGHYEGRSWRGFHHHATLCIAAYGFLVQERGAISRAISP